MNHFLCLLCICIIAGITMMAGEKKQKYLQGFEEERHFYVPEKAHTNKMIMRKGILLKKPKASAVILLCHGFMCSKENARCLRTLFSDYHTFTFDFRAHGEHTQGQCCSFGADEALDVVGAVACIKSDPELASLPIIVYGFSMGAVSSIMAQSQEPLFAAAIWDCPFESTHNLIGRGIERIKIQLFGYEITLPTMIRTLIHRYAYHPYVQEIFKIALKTVSHMDPTPIATCLARVNPEEAAQKITIPALFIACIGDDKTPVSAVKKVYEQTKGYKRLWITSGHCHFDSYFHNPEHYKYKINQFIKKVLDGSYTQKIQEKINDDSKDNA